MEDKPTEEVSNLSSSLSCSFLIDKFFFKKVNNILLLELNFLELKKK